MRVKTARVIEKDILEESLKTVSHLRNKYNLRVVQFSAKVNAWRMQWFLEKILKSEPIEKPTGPYSENYYHTPISEEDFGADEIFIAMVNGKTSA